jgi:hypothetical protein
VTSMSASPARTPAGSSRSEVHTVTDTWQLQVPAGLNGVTLLVQAGVLTANARNGTYETTDAHRFLLQ